MEFVWNLYGVCMEQHACNTAAIRCLRANGWRKALRGTGPEDEGESLKRA
jgi:hypothetical protein